MDNVQLITVTHIIDPSRFYCRNMATADEDKIAIKEVEAKVMQFAATNEFQYLDAEDELKVGTVSQKPIVSLPTNIKLALVGWILLRLHEEVDSLRS